MIPLGRDGADVVLRAIEILDPNHEIVRLDVANSAVAYSTDFETGEAIGRYDGEEEICRAYIVCWLCRKGGYLPANIFLEKRYSIGRPKVGAELDILVRHPDGSAFSLIEVKAPAGYETDQDRYIKGQLFNIAPHEEGASVLTYATVSTVGGSPEIICKTIDYRANKSFEVWSRTRPFSNLIPINYGEPEHVHLVSGGTRDLKQTVTMGELKRLQKRLHDVLWRGSTPDNIIYSYVVKLILAKTHDEKTTNRAQQYRFQIRYPGNQRETVAETFENIASLYKAAYKKYMGLSDQAEVEGLDERAFSKEQTAFVVELLQEISFVRAAGNSDILGSFFEGITREGFKQTKGLFFTHQNIVTFIICVLDIVDLAKSRIRADALQSSKLPHIIDPSCGSGTFLLCAMSAITQGVMEARELLDDRFHETGLDQARPHGTGITLVDSSFVKS